MQPGILQKKKLKQAVVVAKITEGIVNCRESESFNQCVQVALEPLCVLA